MSRLSRADLLRSDRRQDSAERDLYSARSLARDSLVDGGDRLRPRHTDFGHGGLRASVYIRAQISSIGVGQGQHVFSDLRGAGGDGRPRRGSCADVARSLADGRGDDLERRALRLARRRLAKSKPGLTCVVRIQNREPLL